MAYDVNKIAKLKAVKDLATIVNSRLTALETSDAPIKAASVTNNTLNFFTTTDTSTTPAFSFDLPAEQFLDAASTAFVPNFTFSSATYSGATDPSLNGKPVLVLGVKTKNNNESSTTTAFSFLDMSTLVDIYEASDTSVIVTNYKIKANVSSATGNLLSTTANGLFVDGSGKVDKVTGATAGNIAAFVTGGGIQDSGISIATDAEVSEMLTEVIGSAN